MYVAVLSNRSTKGKIPFVVAPSLPIPLDAAGTLCTLLPATVCSVMLSGALRLSRVKPSLLMVQRTVAGIDDGCGKIPAPFADKKKHEMGNEKSSSLNEMFSFHWIPQVLSTARFVLHSTLANSDIVVKS